MSFSLYVEVLIQGMLTGLVYGLMALGLSVIFGVVRVVNFAHGEFLMTAMYAAFGLFLAFALDPLAENDICACIHTLHHVAQKLWRILKIGI